MEEHYEEAVSQHDDWKTAKTKEAWVEQLKQDKKVCLLKVKALKKEKLEAERKAEEKRQENERCQLEKKLKEKEEAKEHQWLADLQAKEKEKKKEDAENEERLKAAALPSETDGDVETDLADPKMAAIAELRQKQKIAKGKKRVVTVEPCKHKFWSASVVEESEGEAEGASAGPSTLKHLKTEPEPQAKDKVLSENGT